MDYRRAAHPGIASFIKLCAAPKEPFRNHCRINSYLQASSQTRTVRGGGTCYRIIPLALFRSMAHMSDWRTTNEATQIPKWIFDQEEQQV